MKTIGIIGGLGPPSTVKYYEWLNEGVRAQLGGQHTAKIILTSVNNQDIYELRMANDPAAEGAFYAAEGQRLERAGADFILIASNTSHKNAPYVEAAVSIPLLHIADATARKIVAQGIKTIGLLGTPLTLERDFYTSRLKAAGLEVLIPEADDRAFMGAEIYGDLTKTGRISDEAENRFAAIARGLVARGAEGIILGCTELTLLDFSTVEKPLFDTTKIHVSAALQAALG